MKLLWSRWNNILMLLTIGVMLSSACASAPEIHPESSIAVLSGWFPEGHTALTMVDGKTWEIFHTTTLPHSTAVRLDRDPERRLWVGLGGTLHHVDNRVQIYDAMGRPISELKTCNIPIAGITFVREQALVACQASGLQSAITVVDRATLAVSKTISIRHPGGDPLLLTASAANDELVVLAGQTRGANAQKTYTLITVLDAHDLTIAALIGPLEGTHIERILSYDGRFYLLNYGNWSEPRTEPTDILIVDPATPSEVTPQALAAAPRWGTIVDGMLYAYHEQRQSLYDLRPTTQLSRWNLENGEVESWTLPDAWDARDLTVIDGQILLAQPGQPGQDSEEGIYRFDPTTGNLTRLVDIVDASAFAVP